MKKEDQNIEYKQSWRDEYLKWACGFANADGGHDFHCGEERSPLYGGLESPVRGFGFPCTRVSVPLYGQNDFLPRVREGRLKG